MKRKAYHKTLKQQTLPHHIHVVKRALKVGQPQKVPKHAQQVEEGLEGRSTSKGSETCSTSCKVWTKVLCKENLSRKQTSPSPFQPLKSFLCHWTEIWRFRPTPTRSRNLFGTSAKRKCHKHTTERNARDDRGATSPLLFFFVPRRTFLFLFIFSAQNPPPLQICNDLFFYCLASSVNNLFLYYLASLSQKHLPLLSCPTSTIIFSIVLPSTDNLILLFSPQKSFPPW